MSTSFFGKDGFIWWKGVVENRKDPIFLGRVKVRIFGWHTEDKTRLPTADLPWAMPSLPLDNGRNSVGPKEGDWCWGFFLDDSDAQKPVVVGYLPGIDEDAANPNIGFYDPTPDEELTGDNVPRPPRMSPVAEYDTTFLEAGADGFSSEFLPENNVAFGQLTSEYSADNYKFDVNQDGTFDSLDVDQMLSQEEIFTGEIKTTIDQQAVDVSRYPLEDLLNEPSTSRLARNENITQTIVASKTSSLSSGEGAGFEGNVLGATEQPAFPFSEPQTAYAAKYPYNHVYESESGHVVEVDDTPGAERLHWYHRSGSFKEIHPSGLEVNKSVNNQYNFVYLDHYCGVGYNYNLDAKQNIRMQSGEAFNIKSGSDHNRQVGGNLNATVSASSNTKIGNSRNVAVGENSNEYVADTKNTCAETINLFGATEVVISSATKVQIVAPIVEIIGETKITGSLAVTGQANLLADMAKSVLLPLPITSNFTGPEGSVPSDNEAEILAETLKDSITASDGSPKYGYLIPNGVTGDVWKPSSDSNGNLVVLSALGGSHELREALPTAQLEAVLIKHKSISGKITEWEVVRPIHTPGDLIDSPASIDMFEDGIRTLARFSKPGAEYPKQLFWMNNGVPILILNSAYRHQCDSPYDNILDFDLTTIRTNEEDSTTNGGEL